MYSQDENSYRGSYGFDENWGYSRVNTWDGISDTSYRCWDRVNWKDPVDRSHTTLWGQTEPRKLMELKT